MNFKTQMTNDILQSMLQEQQAREQDYKNKRQSYEESLHRSIEKQHTKHKEKKTKNFINDLVSSYWSPQAIEARKEQRKRGKSSGGLGNVLKQINPHWRQANEQESVRKSVHHQQLSAMSDLIRKFQMKGLEKEIGFDNASIDRALKLQKNEIKQNKPIQTVDPRVEERLEQAEKRRYSEMVNKEIRERLKEMGIKRYPNQPRYAKQNELFHAEQSRVKEEVENELEQRGVPKSGYKKSTYRTPTSEEDIDKMTPEELKKFIEDTE